MVLMYATSVKIYTSNFFDVYTDLFYIFSVYAGSLIFIYEHYDNVSFYNATNMFF